MPEPVKGHVARIRKHPASARRLAAEEEQAVAAPPGDRDRHAAELVPVAERVAVEGGERRPEGRRRPEVLERQPRLGGRDAPGAGEELRQEQRAARRRCRPAPAPPSAAAPARAATSRGRAGRSGARARSRSPPARSPWPSARRPGAPARARWLRPSSCPPRAAASARARRRSARRRPHRPPPSAPRPAAARASGRTPASRPRSRRGAPRAGRSPGSITCQWDPMPWISTSGSPWPRRWWFTAPGPGDLAVLLRADRPGRAHVLEHEARPVVHHPAAAVLAVPVVGRPSRPSRAGAPARGSLEALCTSGRTSSAAPAARGARSASDHVAHLRLDHHDDRAHAQVGVGPVEHEHVREPGDRDARGGPRRRRDQAVLELAPAALRPPASAARSRWSGSRCRRRCSPPRARGRRRSTTPGGVMRSISSVTSSTLGRCSAGQVVGAEQDALAAERVVGPRLAPQLGVAQLAAHEALRTTRGAASAAAARG